MRRLFVALLMLAGMSGRGHAQTPMQVPPAVWLGFSVDSGTALVVNRVAPNSPAYRAGLHVGDTIVTIDGVAGNRTILERLSARLKTGDAVALQVRRGAVLLTVSVVAQAPVLRGGEMRVTQIQMDSVGRAVRRLLDTALTRAATPGLFYEGKDSTLVFRNPARGTRISIDSLIRAARDRNDSSGTITYARAEERSAVAGAEMSNIDPPLTDYLGVASGLLVLRIAPQSPAERAGLKAGDVVVGVAGSPAPTIAALRAAFAAVRPTRVSIMRNRAPIEITVHLSSSR